MKLSPPIFMNCPLHSQIEIIQFRARALETTVSLTTSCIGCTCWCIPSRRNLEIESKFSMLVEAIIYIWCLCCFCLMLIAQSEYFPVLHMWLESIICCIQSATISTSIKIEGLPIRLLHDSRMATKTRHCWSIFYYHWFETFGKRIFPRVCMSNKEISINAKENRAYYGGLFPVELVKFIAYSSVFNVRPNKSATCLGCR